MSDHPNIDELSNRLEHALALCREPHPGSVSWWESLASALRALDEFHPDGPRDQLHQALNQARALTDDVFNGVRTYHDAGEDGGPEAPQAREEGPPSKTRGLLGCMGTDL